MLTAIQILYVFVVFQMESNSTGTAVSWSDGSPTDPGLNPWGFAFSLTAAIGSGATALALVFIYKQSKLTREQISQTQHEIDSTLRPWIGHTHHEFFSLTVDFEKPPRDVARFVLKNYGRLPARLSGMSSLWNAEEIKERDLTAQPIKEVEPKMLFPDQEDSLDVVGAQSYMIERREVFYFGIILVYEYYVGQGKKYGRMGMIIKVEFDRTTFNSTIIHTLKEEASEKKT